MSVPLLSVNLACLMAIFRSDDLSKGVMVEDLTILIKEAGKALLDPRLTSSSTSPSKLDEATSTQMVRAINKVSIFLLVQFALRYGDSYSYITQLSTCSLRFKLLLGLKGMFRFRL